MSNRIKQTVPRVSNTKSQNLHFISNNACEYPYPINAQVIFYIMCVQQTMNFGTKYDAIIIYILSIAKNNTMGYLDLLGDSCLTLDMNFDWW